MAEVTFNIPMVDVFGHEIYNLSNFVTEEDAHPVINPFKNPREYHDYWESVADKAINGFWGLDYCPERQLGGYRFMTGLLYFHIHLTWMWIEEDGRQIYRNPYCRCIDWHRANAFEAMFGFSGFSGDKEKTCSDIVYKIENEIELLESEKMDIDKFREHLVKEDGSWKEYVDPVKYLCGTFKEKMGKPLYQNQHKNDIWISSRRIGKTEFAKSVSMHRMVFNKARSVEEWHEQTTKSSIIIASVDDGKTADVYKKIWDSFERLSDLGCYYYSEETPSGDVDKKLEGYFWTLFSGSDDLNKVRTNENKAVGGKKKVGPGTTIKRVSVNRNVHKAIGGEPDFVHGEEIGVWGEGVMKFHNITDPAQGKENKFGEILYTGTGGEMKYAKEIIPAFKNPRKIKGLLYDDHYTKSNDKIGCFYPGYYRHRRFYDKNGNIDIQKAFNQDMALRVQAYALGTKSYIDYISQFPMTYLDVFMQETTSEFPIERLSERLVQIQSKDLKDRVNNAGGKIKIGRIKLINIKKGIVEFEENPHLKPIYKPKIKEDLHKDEYTGAVIIYELPKPGEECEYIAAYDSVDYGDGTSLCNVLVLKLFGEKGRLGGFSIAAEYTYRHRGQNSRDKNDIEALKMAMLYDCKLCPETNKPNIISFCENNGLLHWLEEEPVDAIRSMVPGYKEKYGYGMYIVGSKNASGVGMIDGLVQVTAEVLCTLVDIESEYESSYERIKSDGGNEVWMCDKIDSQYLIEELIFWKKTGNYDSVSSLFILATIIRNRLMNGSLKQKEEKGNKIFSKFINSMDEVKGEQLSRESFAFNY